ncbi:MAG: DNA (cytosine-5-)-methyltransferase [Candidatus Didemnitutus sp.]|nr:DNA (cytosine-5-)-methyltransferase [Candidatus Didemnitutus sp.]
MRIAGLFAGIGGIELGLQEAGHEGRLLCEIDAGASKVLAERFKDTEIVADVRKLRSLPKEVDLLAGGFPCQDLSQAGGTAGISGRNSGLVTEIFRLIKRRRPAWLFLENVSFMLQLARGNAMDFVASSLEDLGYRWAYRVVDSRAFGVPQRRKRVFIIASLKEDPRSVLFADEAGDPAEMDHAGLACGFYWTEGTRGLGWAVDSIPTLKGGSTVGIPSPPAIWCPDGRFITPDIRDAERLQGFPVDWTLPAETVTRASMRWKMVGNAVTVPAAAWVGSRLAKPGKPVLAASRPLKAGTPFPTAAWFDGKQRHAIEISQWPLANRWPSLLSFLKFPGKPLSRKAAEGFLRRLTASSLDYPPRFAADLARHIERHGDKAA